MPLYKTGVSLVITRRGSLTDVARGETVLKEANTNASEFIYFATRAIAGDDPNGNGDYFPWGQLLKSFSSFVGRSLFLNHDSGDPRNAIGKVLDAYPVVDKDTGEKYIECLAKIDAVAHPELARQISTGILDSCSMGCSVESSTCSICGHTIHSDQDGKCHHMSKGLLKEYIAEMDFPDYGIKKGSRATAYAINQGLNFTELSVVNVPAWNNAKIVQIIAKLKQDAAQGTATPEMLKGLEDLIKMAEETQKGDIVEETATPTPQIPKEVESKQSRIKKLFSEKLSALDYLDLLDYMNKNVEIKAEVVPAPETKVEEIAKVEEKPVEAPKVEAKIEEKVEVKAEVVPEAPKPEEKPIMPTPEAPKVEAPKVEAKKNYKAIFVAKPAVEESYWVVTESGKPVLKATLGTTWKTRLSDVVDYATSADYGETLLQRLEEEGLDKVAKITNATIYTEAAKSHPEGIDLNTKPAPPAQRGQVGKGEEWPSQKSVGKDQYTPAADEHKAKMKDLPEGVDMSGGAAPAAAAGPSWAKGDESPASKSVGKDQYKPAGGGGPKAKSEYMEKAAEKETPIAKTAEPVPADLMAPPAEVPAEMPAEVPAEMAAEVSAAPEADVPMKPIAEMSDEEKLEMMIKLLEKMSPSDKLRKPVEAVRKAVEKLEAAFEKQQAADAKEAEKADAAREKEEDKAAKDAEKAAKAEEKAEKKEEKPEEKPEKEEKVEEKKEEMPEMEKKAEVTPEAPKPEPVVEVTPSERELALEAQLRQIKLEQSLREKMNKVHTIVSEMVDKELITPEEKDIQAEIASGLPLFDARASAFKKAIDKQCKDLLAMEEPTLKAFAQTIGRMKARAASNSNTGVLKKAFNLQFTESRSEDTWLKDVFNNMGSKKGK